VSVSVRVRVRVGAGLLAVASAGPDRSGPRGARGHARRRGPWRPARLARRPVGTLPGGPQGRQAGAARARLNAQRPAPVAAGFEQKARKAHKAHKRARERARAVKRRARVVCFGLLHAGNLKLRSNREPLRKLF
jgi:hypothetical protein